MTDKEDKPARQKLGYRHATKKEMKAFVRQQVGLYGAVTREYMLGQLRFCRAIDPSRFGKMWVDAIELYDLTAVAEGFPEVIVVQPIKK